jgi:hypothetical protein
VILVFIPNIGVIHLIWGPCGIETFHAFLQSYIKNPAGLEHELILIFNGFPSEKEILEYKSLLKNFHYSSLFIKEPGFDISSYYIATNAFHYDFYCFLNSYSVILDKDWLTKLYHYASQEHVGLVGATGSGTSWHSQLLENRDDLKTMAVYRGLMGRMRLILRIHFYTAYFDPFPNYHIRTNAFMIARDLFLHIHRPRRSTKLATYLFESGKNSMTKQVHRMGLQTLVIGRNGRAYAPDAWWESNTFWQNDQSNLLVADNQTNKYVRADIKEKWRLAKTAWGAHANVGEPRTK